jgi:hypothetical protein
MQVGAGYPAFGIKFDEAKALWDEVESGACRSPEEIGHRPWRLQIGTTTLDDAC